MSKYKVPWGKDRATEEWRRVSEVRRGAACDCVCPVCNAPLIAKQGAKTTWHFAHRPREGKPGCGEGAIHLRCKQVLSASRGEPIVLPGHDDWYIKIHSIEEEVPLPKTGRRPDLLADLLVNQAGAAEKKTKLAIEIRVSNPKDAEYRAAMRDEGISAVELVIDLDVVREMDDDALRKALLQGSEIPRKWLHWRGHEDRVCKGKNGRYCGNVKQEKHRTCWQCVKVCRDCKKPIESKYTRCRECEDKRLEAEGLKRCDECGKPFNPGDEDYDSCWECGGY